MRAVGDQFSIKQVLHARGGRVSVEPADILALSRSWAADIGDFKHEAITSIAAPAD
jgi:hypothetical protein